MTTTTITSCDGPGCDVTTDDPCVRRLCDEPWLRLEHETGYEPDLHFHSRACLAAWATTTTERNDR